MITVEIGDSVPLTNVVSDGRDDLYCRASILDDSGAEIGVVYPSYKSSGVYSVSWTPPDVGYYTVVYQLFHDSGYLHDANYDLASEDIRVTEALSTSVSAIESALSSMQLALARLLGLSQENSVIDSQIYNEIGNLTSARIRCYNSSANAAIASSTSPASYNTGLVASYTVSATYNSSGALTKYAVVQN